MNDIQKAAMKRFAAEMLKKGAVLRNDRLDGRLVPVWLYSVSYKKTGAKVRFITQLTDELLRDMNGRCGVIEDIPGLDDDLEYALACAASDRVNGKISADEANELSLLLARHVVGTEHWAMSKDYEMTEGIHIVVIDNKPNFQDMQLRSVLVPNHPEMLDAEDIQHVVDSVM